MWGIGIRLNLYPWFSSMKKLRSAFSSRVLSLNIECREPVTRSARSYKEQQMTIYEVCTDEIFCEKDEAVCTFRGKPPGAQIPVYLSITVTIFSLWSPSACLAYSEREKSLGRKQNSTSLYEREKQAVWLQLELRQESQKSITWHQGLNLGESGKIMAVFVQKIPSVKVSKWDIAFITLYWCSGIDFSFICWSASQSAEFLHQLYLAPHSFMGFDWESWLGFWKVACPRLWENQY